MSVVLGSGEHRYRVVAGFGGAAEYGFLHRRHALHAGERLIGGVETAAQLHAGGALGLELHFALPLVHIRQALALERC